MAIVACQASTSSPTVSLASERATWRMSSTESSARASWNSVRSMLTFSAQLDPELGDFRGLPEQFPVNGVFPRPIWAPLGCRSELRTHQTVEDVGLADQHLVEAEHPKHAHQHPDPAHDPAHASRPGPGVFA